MSKAKKQKPDDEPIKLDMSFEDAINLAANTAPMYEVKLKLNEPMELKKVSGRRVELVCLDIYKGEGSIVALYLITQVIYPQEGKSLAPKNNPVYPNAFDPNNTLGYFSLPIAGKKIIVVPDKAILIVTLAVVPGKTTNAKSVVLTYKKHTNAKP